MTIFDIRKLTVVYGKAVALDGISLSVCEGKIACILGSNGAGKSSLLRCVVGLAHAESGSVTWKGEEITNLRPHEVAVRGIALAPEGRRLFPGLTIYENLCAGAYLRRRDASFRAQLERVYSYFPILRNRRNQVAGSLSGGEQQMCAIGRALMGLARLLLLDEPSLGLAPIVVANLAEIIREIGKAAITIILVEQNARMALRLSDYGYVLETGRLALEGPSADLRHNPYVTEIYLGGRKAGFGNGAGREVKEGKQ